MVANHRSLTPKTTNLWFPFFPRPRRLAQRSHRLTQPLRIRHCRFFAPSVQRFAGGHKVALRTGHECLSHGRAALRVSDPRVGVARRPRKVKVCVCVCVAGWQSHGRHARDIVVCFPKACESENVCVCVCVCACVWVCAWVYVCASVRACVFGCKQIVV